jgi:putative membrane protein
MVNAVRSKNRRIRMRAAALAAVHATGKTAAMRCLIPPALAAILLAGIGPVAAEAQEAMPDGDMMPGMMPDSAVQAPAEPLAPADAAFIDAVGAGVHAEIAFAQLAPERAGRDEVRAFADRMIADHSDVIHRLYGLEQQKGLKPPGTMKAGQQQRYQELQALDGDAFDALYLKSQGQERDALAQALQEEIDGGSDPELRSFAQQTLAVVERHLALARSIAAP